MKTPQIQIINDTGMEDSQQMVIFQTAPDAGWKKVTAWKAIPLPKGASAETELPEDYSISLEYTRNEVTVSTEQLPVYNGIGAFKVSRDQQALQLERVAHDPDSTRLEVEAEKNFEGYVELLIFKGAERIFPKIQLGPGWRTSPQLNGPFYVTRLPHGKIGANFLELLAAPKVEVKPWDKVRLTGDRKSGYALAVIGKLRYT
jgi:hypothetical protein